MKFILLPHASRELAAAVEYYEGEEAGLGERLWREVDGAREVIRIAHETGPLP